MLLKSLLLLTLLSAFLFSYASACSCMFLPLEQRIQNSANVFHGEVLSVSDANYELTYKVRVHQSCKLDKSRVGADGTVKVQTASSSAACGVSGLTVGSSYTFLADERMFLASCTWSGDTAWAEAEKICLATPQNDGGSCVCHEMYAPVCAAVANGPKTTYSNGCKAECAGAALIHQGACGHVDGPILVHPGAPVVDIPHFPHPPQQPYMMTMDDAVNEVCSLCDRLSHSHHPMPIYQPGIYPVEPARPMPYPTPEFQILPYPGPEIRPIEVHPMPMPEPDVLEPENCFCILLYAPVCAIKRDGTKETFGNSCQAGCAGATIVHEGECGTNNAMRADLRREIPVDSVNIATLP